MSTEERFRAAGELDRNEWEVAPIVDHAECVRLLRLWHYAKGAPNTSTYRHGLYRVGETVMAHPWGLALWIPPTRTAAESVAGELWEGVLALSRFVIAPDAPRNAASFLLGRSMKMIDRRRWPWLLTYADTGEGHTGGIYKATNWTSLGETKAGDTWIGPNGEQRGRKRGQRTWSRAEMEAHGFTQRPARAKIKFVHHVGYSA